MSVAFLIFGQARAGETGTDDQAADGNEQGIEFFERSIRPLFVKHCYECHSSKADELQGGLSLELRGGWIEGGDSGPAIVPGDPDASLLIEAVRYEGYEMPPSGRLATADVQLLEEWVRRGAPAPEDGKTTPSRPAGSAIDWDAAREFWSFRPIVDPAVPEVDNTAWPRTAIDRFILSRLEAEQLAPTADAEPAKVVRRLSFDLTGLPPSVEMLSAVKADDSPESIERLVDRMLASPEYGERWGRHWLDVARYADSTGGGRSLLYDAAWRYRDYVIQSFGEDKPFDRFIVEQIAGDLLPYDDYRDGQDQIVATGFLALGPTNYELQDKQQLRMDVVDEQLDTIGRAFLGMTIGCARCHDHKFDPIPTRDYYALAGFLRSTQSLVDANVSSWVRRDLPLPPEEQLALTTYNTAMANLTAAIETSQKRLKKLQSAVGMVTLDDADAELEGDWSKSTSVRPFEGDAYQYTNSTTHRARYALPIGEAGRYELRVSYTPHPNRDRAARYVVHHREGESVVDVDQRETPTIDGMYATLGEFGFEADGDGAVVVQPSGGGAAIVDGLRLIRVDADGDGREALLRDLHEAESEFAGLTAEEEELRSHAPKGAEVAMAVAEEAEPEDCCIMIRGDIRREGERVPRGFLTVVSGETGAAAVDDDTSGRLALAQWIASDSNPMTARVAVNRVWHHLFGRGLVRTVENFGATGEVPSDPALLDFLARRFIDSGWSMKSLIREIVRSRTYQLSTEASDDLTTRDPQNRWLGRQNRRRLDAEAIRDTMLLVSGELAPFEGGSSVRDGTKSEYGYDFEERHRSVYLPIFRNQVHDLLTVFDFPDPNLSVSRRTTSTLPTQSLYMMNSPLVIDQAERTAERMLERSDLDDGERFRWLYLLAMSREPTEQETALALDFLDADPGENDDARRTGWAAVCQAVFASIDFRYVD